MNLTEEQERTLSQALDKYGDDSQIDMCIEECSELIQALCKYKRSKGNISNIKEEIADVYIMIKQMEILFGSIGVESIQGHIDFKVNRLNGRIES